MAFGCANPPAPTPSPGPAPGELNVQIGLLVGAASVALGGDAALAFTEPDGRCVLDIPAGQVWRATPVGGGIALTSGAGVAVNTVPAARVEPADSAAVVRVNGRAYRGTLALLRDPEKRKALLPSGKLWQVVSHAPGDPVAHASLIFHHHCYNPIIEGWYDSLQSPRLFAAV